MMYLKLQDSVNFDIVLPAPKWSQILHSHIALHPHLVPTSNSSPPSEPVRLLLLNEPLLEKLATGEALGASINHGLPQGSSFSIQ
jgi:hypothetical protein